MQLSRCGQAGRPHRPAQGDLEITDRTYWTEPTFDLLVFIGRFAPPHHGHFRVMQQALNRAKYLLVLLGSANAATSARNPFDRETREAMIYAGLQELGAEADARVLTAPVDDFLYRDQAWIAQVQARVAQTLVQLGDKLGAEPKVGLVGHSKDHTSYYLTLFPDFGAV